MRRPEMVGLSVAIIENGQITFAKGYGKTEKRGDAVTADTVFRWASVSKSVGSATASLDPRRCSVSAQRHGAERV